MIKMVARDGDKTTLIFGVSDANAARIKADDLLLEFKGVVFVVKPRGNSLIVATVLTKEQAIVNMQSIDRRLAFDLPDIAPPNESQLVTRKPLSIAELAAKHAQLKPTKKQRLAELVGEGYELGGVNGMKYACAYEACVLTLSNNYRNEEQPNV